jgi:release factor glutamine methyltransferase
MLTVAARLLHPGGWLGIEHADVQGAALPALVRAHGSFTDVEDHSDLAGRPRFTTARRR